MLQLDMSILRGCFGYGGSTVSMLAELGICVGI